MTLQKHVWLEVYIMEAMNPWHVQCRMRIPTSDTLGRTGNEEDKGKLKTKESPQNSSFSVAGTERERDRQRKGETERGGVCVAGTIF